MVKIVVERDCGEIYCEMCESQVYTRKNRKYGKGVNDKHKVYSCGEFYDNHREVLLEFDIEKEKNKRCQQCLDAEMKEDK